VRWPVTRTRRSSGAAPQASTSGASRNAKSLRLDSVLAPVPRGAHSAASPKPSSQRLKNGPFLSQMP